MKKFIISPLILLAVLFMFSFGCDPVDPDPFDPVDPVDPVDPGDFETVTIGTQVWMKHNLNIETGNSWCYDYDPANCEIYGRLYDWETALTVCPSGWRLPSDADWTTLTDYLGGESVAGGKMKSTGTIEAGTGLWYDPNTDATNESGWSGLPGGSRYGTGGFGYLGNYGLWWSASERDAGFAWGRDLGYNYGIVARGGSNKGNGFSVRCLIDPDPFGPVDPVEPVDPGDPYTISGTVSGDVHSGVTMTLSGDGSYITLTDSGGNYSFSGLVNGSYTVTPSNSGYTFTPTSKNVTVSEADVTGVDFISTAAVNSVAWIKSYGERGSESADSIQLTTDNGYIIAGTTYSDEAREWGICVLNLNSTGNISRQQFFKGFGLNGLSRPLIQKTGNDYIIALTYLNIDNLRDDIGLIKYDSSEDTVSCITYGGDKDDTVHCFQKLNDGCYIVVGGTSSFGAGASDIWVVKFNADLSVAWQKAYGGENSDIGHSIQQTTDGGYIVSGSTMSFGYNISLWILKLDGSGNIQWQKTYDDGLFGNVLQIKDGNYIVAGVGSPYIGSNGYSTCIFKLDNDGNLLWEKAYEGGGTVNYHSIQQTEDKGYIVITSIPNPDTDNTDIVLLKLNEDGALLWQKTYGAELSVGSHNVHQTQDEGYIALGGVNTGTDVDILVLKTDSQGNIPRCAIARRGKFSECSISIRSNDSNCIITSTDALMVKPYISSSEKYFFNIKTICD